MLRLKLGILSGLALGLVQACGTSGDSPPGDGGPSDSRADGSPQLTPVSGGQIVYDGNQNVYWLANANLAADPTIVAQMGVANVDPNGAMDYATAQAWVAALNAKSYLGHDNWQLPATPMKDPTCGAMGPQGASFGGLCQGSALGNLYYVGLHQMLPDDVAPSFDATIGPFQHVQLAYYWTAADGGLSGKQIYSFIGDGDATTITDSYYSVLPMVPQQYGPIGGTAPTCPTGVDVVPYAAGPGAQAVYECATGNTWLADANLAASMAFDITGDVAGGIVEKRPYPTPDATTITAPQISGGAMLWSVASQWVAAMNASNGGQGWLGSNHWQLPASAADLKVLYGHLHLPSGDPRLAASGSFGPFQNLQPFFYWQTCVPDPNGVGGTSTDCAAGNAPPATSGNQMNYDFTFGYGIQGTDVATLKYFVMVYYRD